MRTPAVTVSIAAFLAGCATPAEQAAQAEREVDRMVRIYGPDCEKLRFKGNSDPWRNRIIGLSQKDAVARYSNNVFYGPAFWNRPYRVY